jgi:hypothetical protein
LQLIKASCGVRGEHERAEAVRKADFNEFADTWVVANRVTPRV